MSVEHRTRAHWMIFVPALAFLVVAVSALVAADMSSTLVLLASIAGLVWLAQAAAQAFRRLYGCDPESAASG